MCAGSFDKTTSGHACTHCQQYNNIIGVAGTGLDLFHIHHVDNHNTNRNTKVETIPSIGCTKKSHCRPFTKKARGKRSGDLHTGFRKLVGTVQNEKIKSCVNIVQ